MTMSRIFALLAFLFAVLCVLVLPKWFSWEIAKSAALVTMTIGLWATGILPGYLTALLFFAVAMLFQAAPADIIFSGFQSAALWLVFAGLILGVAIQESALGERMATRVVQRLGDSYTGIIAGLVLIGVMLGFLMPSSLGRVVLLVPIAVAIADRCGFQVGSNGRTGIVFAAAFGSHVPTFAILPSNVPNMILAGASESLYHVILSYGQYLLLHFPVLGLLKSVAIIVLILVQYPDKPNLDRASAPDLSPMSSGERRLAIILFATLGLWMTDGLHHISPAWVGLAAAMVCMMPGVGLVSSRSFSQRVNFASLFYVAGIIGLGSFVAHSGLGKLMAQLSFSVLPLKPGAIVQNFASLTGLAALLGIVTTLPGTPAVLTPLAGDIAQASGFPLVSVLMTQVLGFSTVLLPYESAPLVVAVQLGKLSIVQALKLCLSLSVVTFLLLMPLDFLWWRLLGML